MKVLGACGAWFKGGVRAWLLMGGLGGGGSERYIMLWTDVMPEEEIMETPLVTPGSPEPPVGLGLPGLHREDVMGARGATGGGATSFLVYMYSPK